MSQRGQPPRRNQNGRPSPSLQPLPLHPSLSPSDAVDVLPGVVRRVELDDPVHGGDVQAARRDIRAQQDAGGGLAMAMGRWVCWSQRNNWPPSSRRSH